MREKGDIGQMQGFIRRGWDTGANYNLPRFFYDGMAKQI